jgi:hypothetical protein
MAVLDNADQLVTVIDLLTLFTLIFVELPSGPVDIMESGGALVFSKAPMLTALVIGSTVTRRAGV